MKKFYSVKEAAEILGFSTNTIYAYLDEGKLKAKRIGKGRFKIPYEELEPYLSTGEKVESLVSEKVRGDKISKVLDGASSENLVAPGIRDFLFFRIFLALSIIGIGFVHLGGKDQILIETVLDKFGLSGFLVCCTVMPLLVVLAGSLIFLLAVFREKFLKFSLQIHIFAVTVLFFSAFYLISLKFYESSVFFLVSGLILLGHQLRGYLNCLENSSLYKEMIYYTFVVLFIGGILIFFIPQTIPFVPISDYVAAHKGIFLLVWYPLITFPAYYLITKEYVERSASQQGILFFYALIALSFGTGFSIQAKWDLAITTYLFAIFILFLVWWKRSQERLERKAYQYLVLAFVWTTFIVVLGLLSVSSLQENVKNSTLKRMDEKLSEITHDIDFLFSETEGVMNVQVEKGGVKQAILGGSSELATSIAEEIYNNSPELRRILILDGEGNAVGVYPRNIELENTNFSGRDYFQTTKKTLRGHISNVFLSVLDTKIVVQTVPVFNGNSFIGMVFVAYHLENLSDKYQFPGAGGDIFAYDENKVYVLNPDHSQIGAEVDSKIVQDREKGLIKNDFLRAYDWAKIPRWTVYLERTTQSVIGRLGGVNEVITLVILGNSIFALAVGVTLARKWKAH